MVPVPEKFFDWCSADDVLKELGTTLDLEKVDLGKNRDAREAWIIAKFSSLVLPGDKCDIMLCKESFPDAKIRIEESGHIKYYEITQAFEGGDKMLKTPAEGKSKKHLEKIFLEGLHMAIVKKVEKHYDGAVHLLIYINNIPTWGLSQKFLEEHEEEFERYRGQFKSLNVLSTRAGTAVQIHPKFKRFPNK